MGANDVPFMYSPVKHDLRFPEKEFDPKAITRASWEKPKPKPKKDGPLVSFARHPDAHEVIGGRTSKYRPMSNRTKSAIKWLRRFQLGIRVLQIVGALGILTLMILISNVVALTAWVVRITAGVVTIHCVYGAIHHTRPARARTPASSAAYQLFASVFDLAAMPLYGFGMLAVRNQSGDWATLINNEEILNSYFIPALYYTLISAAGLHLLSMAIGLYQGLVFRRISRMPPDMNPLEDHLTARISSRHKRNKSSVATYSTVSTSDDRLSAPLEAKRRSGAPYEDVNRPPSIPFMHARTNSGDSHNSKRDSRLNLPSRHYQVQPSNSPRNSVTDLDLKKQYVPSARASIVTQSENFVTYPSMSRASAASISATSVNDQTNYTNSYSTGGEDGKRSSAGSNGTPRQPRFTEAWYTSDSLLDRTNKRAAKQRDSKTYSALTQRYEFDDGSHYSSDEDDSDAENRPVGSRLAKSRPGGRGAYANIDRQDTVYRSGYYPEDVDIFTGESRTPPMEPQPTPQSKKSAHPNPLGQHPTNSDLNMNYAYNSQKATANSNINNATRGVSPLAVSEVSALSEVDLNNRRVSGCDIADAPIARPTSEYIPRPRRNGNPSKNSNSKPSTPTKVPTPSRPFSIADPITGPGAVTGRLSPYTTNTLTPPKPRAGTPNTNSSGGVKKATPTRTPTKFTPKNRNSSIQAEEGLFVAKSYGDLRAATPPVMVGSTRQVSSGNDYGAGGNEHSYAGINAGDLGASENSSRYLGSNVGSIFGRRNISGKVAEEGRARWSRYSKLNED